ncbi:MAG: DUF6293 family protein [Candidatus Bathyarchaeia archaeon]|jgi:hypothetical protein
MTRVLVSPVGIYKNRVLKGVKWLKPEWIYLLVAKGEKGNVWVECTERNAKEITEKIGFFYEKQIKVLPCNFENYRDFFEDLDSAIADVSKNVSSPEIWIDLTSVPEIPEISILAMATIHKNIKLFYTKAKKPLEPEQYPKNVVTDEGGDSIELPTIRSIPVEDLRESNAADILLTVSKASGTLDGLSNLLDELKMSREKKNYMKLGRILDGLEKYGMIVVEKINREKRIRLTIWGEMIAACLAHD